jgi:hypothetical protein
MQEHNSREGIFVENAGPMDLKIEVYPQKDMDNKKRDIDCMILRKLNSSRTCNHWSYHTPSHWTIITNGGHLERILETERKILDKYAQLRNLESIKQLKDDYASNKDAAHTLSDVVFILYKLKIKDVEKKIYKAADILKVYEKRVNKIIKKFINITQ